jgi:hypothetical protein
MPPIIGTAIRCITYEPVPVLHIIGNSAAMMATTVIIFGRTRSTAPNLIASLKIAASAPRRSAAQHRRALELTPPKNCGAVRQSCWTARG